MFFCATSVASKFSSRFKGKSPWRITPKFHRVLPLPLEIPSLEQNDARFSIWGMADSSVSERMIRVFVRRLEAHVSVAKQASICLAVCLEAASTDLTTAAG